MKILYLFTVDYNKEIADCERGVVPTHRLWGYVETAKMGHEPIACPSPKYFRKRLSKPVFWRIYQALYAWWKQGEVDCIFAINEAGALPVLVLKWLRLLRTPIVIVSTGLMHKRNQSGKRKAMWKRLLPRAEAIVSLSTMEVEATWREFGLRPERQHLVNMLVDINYFGAGGKLGGGDYCLSAGTNEGRDYPTLLKAFPRDEKLLIVTDPYNAAIIEKHREPGMQVEVRQAVPIGQLKELYQRAKAIINPIGEVDFASGHTILLENMSLGRPVIVSMVRGMKDYFQDGVTAIGVKPYDVEDMRQKLRAFLDAPEKFTPIGERATEWVRRFSSEEFARKLLVIATGLLGEAPGHCKSCAAQPAIELSSPAK
ncbi:MAG: glycosyltransferase family 4 protein [Chthoniobacteraceae bacterium]|jgi:glycosyltransferase involved in cell wall biosynthesis